MRQLQNLFIVQTRHAYSVSGFHMFVMYTSVLHHSMKIIKNVKASIKFQKCFIVYEQIPGKVGLEILELSIVLYLTAFIAEGLESK